MAQAEREGLPRARFPARVQTIDGKTIDVARLAETRRVVVVTLKATSCPVCQEQLRRIHRALPDPERCGIALLVLSPGPADALKEIRSGVGLSYPFIEDRDLSIATSFGLRLARDQMEPAILVLERDLSVGWMQRGRSGAYFGDPALQREINCAGVI